MRWAKLKRLLIRWPIDNKFEPRRESWRDDAASGRRLSAAGGGLSGENNWTVSLSRGAVRLLLILFLHVCLNRKTQLIIPIMGVSKGQSHHGAMVVMLTVQADNFN